MIEAANHSGLYQHPENGRSYPKAQIITVEDLLEGRRPKLPPTQLPYFQAKRRAADESDQLSLDDLGDDDVAL
jgi:hypothetical protein